MIAEIEKPKIAFGKIGAMKTKTCTEYFVKLPSGQYLIQSWSPHHKPIAVIDSPVAWEDKHDAECYASQIEGAELIEGETYEYEDAY